MSKDIELDPQDIMGHLKAHLQQNEPALWNAAGDALGQKSLDSAEQHLAPKGGRGR